MVGTCIDISTLKLKHEWRMLYLVGGLEPDFYDFPFSWECHVIPTDVHSIIFQRGGEKPPARYGQLALIVVFQSSYEDATLRLPR